MMATMRFWKRKRYNHGMGQVYLAGWLFGTVRFPVGIGV